MGSVHCYFCHGHKCKYENYDNWLDAKNSHNAIVGLYSNWITDNILATARPSSRLMEKYDIIDQFHEHNIGAIINLQQAGEHKECGDGLVNDEFSYSPDDFMRANIFYYNFGWKDMTVPPIDLVLNIVQVMCFTHSQDKKIAIHCHAGLGRTGLVIACYLVYTNRFTAQEAVTQVRVHRPLSIQTTKQANFIKAFEEFTRSIRIVYDDSQPSLDTVLTRQRKYLHGPEALALRHSPKILVVACERITACLGATAGEAVVVLRDLSEEEKAQLVRHKGEVDNGVWEGTMQADGAIVVQMLLEWLNQLSPRMLHEGAEAILSGKQPQCITPTLSKSVLKSLALLVNTLHKIAANSQEQQQLTLYSTFAKALVPFPKSKTVDDSLLLSASAFLRDINF